MHLPSARRKVHHWLLGLCAAGSTAALAFGFAPAVPAQRGIAGFAVMLSHP